MSSQHLHTTKRIPAAEAAEYLGVETQTLAVWRSTARYSLPFTKIGRLVFYNVADLDAWIASRTGTSSRAIARATA